MLQCQPTKNTGGVGPARHPAGGGDEDGADVGAGREGDAAQHRGTGGCGSQRHPTHFEAPSLVLNGTL